MAEPNRIKSRTVGEMGKEHTWNSEATESSDESSTAPGAPVGGAPRGAMSASGAGEGEGGTGTEGGEAELLEGRGDEDGLGVGLDEAEAGQVELLLVQRHRLRYVWRYQH